MTVIQELKKQPLTEAEFKSIAACSTITCVLLGPEEDAVYFWLVDLEYDAVPWRILIRHWDYHLEPCVYQLWNRTIAVGLIDHYYVLKNSRIIRRHKLPFLFWEIIFADQARVVVLHEIGFTCFTPDGRVLWEEVIDLMGGWKIEDGLLYYKTFDGEEGVIDINRKRRRERTLLGRIAAVRQFIFRHNRP